MSALKQALEKGLARMSKQQMGAWALTNPGPTNVSQAQTWTYITCHMLANVSSVSECLKLMRRLSTFNVSVS